MSAAPNNTTSQSLTAPQAFTVVSILFTLTLALFGNTLVLVAFCRFHSLRTVTNYFVVSLAVADVMVASLSMPCWLYIRVEGLTDVPRDDSVSQLLYYSWQFIDILCSTASIVNLCIISWNRWVAINTPLVYDSTMTASKALLSIAGAWLAATLSASLSLITLHRPLRPLSGRVFGFVISTVAFFVPLLMLVIVYGSIWRVALRQVKQIASSNVVDAQRDDGKRRATFLRELKVTKTLGVVVGAFVVCWCPFFTLIMMYAVCPGCSFGSVWVVASKALHYLNSTLNPLIYTALTQDFRRAFRKLLRAPRCCCRAARVAPDHTDFSLTATRR